MPRFPIVMKTWAGEASHDLEYIQRSLPSLLSSDLPDSAEILIYDDCSPNQRLHDLLRETAQADRRVRLVFGETNRGPNWGQEYIYSIVESDYPDAPFFVNVDDDVIYHRQWLVRLQEAWRQLRGMGVDGVYTALHMPFRRTESTLDTGGRRYHIKWKQPALNWFIPRNVYRAVGPFRDEGIAYDTVYSHWMRLKNYPVICLTPSMVQNIGLLGAYATDDTTTSRDFIGEGDGYGIGKRLLDAALYTVNRVPDYLRSCTDSAPERYAPIRWGSDFVYEGRTGSGESSALFSPLDGLGQEQTQQRILQRVEELQSTPVANAFAVSGVHFDRHGTLKWVETDWRFLPNLREVRRLGLLEFSPDPIALLRALAEQLAPLHQHGVVHNKVRQDNVYVDSSLGNAGFHLAWLGTEPPEGIAWGDDLSAELLARLGSALNRWARPDTKERVASEYLEAVAPEVLAGGKATPASDLYAAAAVVVLTCMPEMDRRDLLTKQRLDWAQGQLPLQVRDNAILCELLSECLQTDPQLRKTDARDLLRALN